MLPAIQQSLTNLNGFLVYFSVALLLLLLFKFVYVRLTPHDEWKLLREQKNTAAAAGFGGAIIGFSLALASAAANSVSLTDFVIWGVVALVAQALAFALVRLLFLPQLSQQIIDDELSAGIMLGCTSIAVGLLNGACMTY